MVLHALPVAPRASSLCIGLGRALVCQNVIATPCPDQLADRHHTGRGDAAPAVAAKPLAKRYNMMGSFPQGEDNKMGGMEADILLFESGNLQNKIVGKRYQKEVCCACPAK